MPMRALLRRHDRRRERQVVGIGDLELVGLPVTSRGLSAQRFHGLGFVGVVDGFGTGERARAGRRTGTSAAFARDHRPSRGSVAALRPSASARFSVPTTGSASKPPTASCSELLAQPRQALGIDARTHRVVDQDPVVVAGVGQCRQRVADGFAARRAAAAQDRDAGPRADDLVVPAIAGGDRDMDLLPAERRRRGARGCARAPACRRASSIAWASRRESGCRCRQRESTRDSASRTGAGWSAGRSAGRYRRSRGSSRRATHAGSRSTSSRAADAPPPVRRRRSRARSRRRSARTPPRSDRP